ncbi:MAG: FAD-dependent thymidylate synthase [Chloroflexi bacterium]|nr:FAD-dependent thymidylate synthase [Chloroflexota bacterium]
MSRQPSPGVSERSARPSADEPGRAIYTIWGVPPETQAYAMAKYSRSNQSMRESIAELSAQKAADFLETFYFQYGHRSIADLAHLAFAIENISLWAAVRVVDEPLWDGQERSTRYQPFSRTGYFTPEIASPEAARRYREANDRLFAAYEGLSRGLTDVLTRVVARPEEMEEPAYRRTLRARAFDVARYLLPLATRTSVGQVVSARVLERQISRLAADQLPECRAIAAELKDACARPPDAPTLHSLAARLPVGALDDLLVGGAAPTLVKYAAPSPYPAAARAALVRVAAELLGGSASMRCDVALAEPLPLDVEIVATLLYEVDAERRPFSAIARQIAALSPERRAAIVATALADRGRHDEHLRAFRSGYPLTFEIRADVGAFRDLHRHRRCVQIIREPSPAEGFDDAGEIFRAGLTDAGAELATREGHRARYEQALEAAVGAYQDLREDLGDEAIYCLPLAARVRALFKMDLAEALYITELRTGPTGHFAYRRIAWMMNRALAEHYPGLAAGARVYDPSTPIDLLRR